MHLLPHAFALLAISDTKRALEATRSAVLFRSETGKERVGIAEAAFADYVVGFQSGIGPYLPFT